MGVFCEVRLVLPDLVTYNVWLIAIAISYAIMSVEEPLILATCIALCIQYQ